MAQRADAFAAIVDGVDEDYRIIYISSSGHYCHSRIFGTSLSVTSEKNPSGPLEDISMIVSGIFHVVIPRAYMAIIFCSMA